VVKDSTPRPTFLQILFNGDIVEVFGLLYEGFKTTNLNLHPKMRKDLLRLYWKVYGTNQVTNNKFMIWFMKGYIVQKKGEKVNWLGLLLQ
jgi:hypothetical protein